MCDGDRGQSSEDRRWNVIFLKTNNEIESALRNYHWLVKEVARLRHELSHIDPCMSSNTGGGDPSGRTGRIANPTLNEVLRREHKLETLRKFESKIDFVEKHSICITNDRELTVLNCLLDGMNINSISRHMGYSKRTIYAIKEEIIRKMKEHSEEKQ